LNVSQKLATKGQRPYVLVRLLDSHQLLKPAEILGLWANPIFVAPSWSHPKNRSRIRTQTLAKRNFLT